MTNEERAAYLVARSFEGGCSGDELAELRRLAKADASLAAYIDTLRTARLASWPASEERRPDPERLLGDLRRRIAASKSADAAPPSRSMVSQRRAMGVRSWRRMGIPAYVAAVGVVAVAIGGALATYMAPLHPGAQQTAFVRRYDAARGKRLVATLPDSSRVTLGPASSLTYSAGPTSGRTLTLVGEGYFIVHHDAKRPFTVHVGNAATRDLGTQFYLRSYPTDHEVELLVTDGEVLVRASGQEGRRRALEKGGLATVTRAGDITVKPAGNTDQYLAWTNGQLVFHDTPLARVVDDVGRWYDLDIVVKGASLPMLPIRGPLPTTSMDDALGVLASAISADWQRKGRSVVLVARWPGLQNDSAVASLRSQ